MRRLIILLLLASCGDRLTDDNTDVLSYSINHDSIIERIELKKQLRAFEMDSLGETMELLKGISSMREINLKNKLEKVKDSLVHELEAEHEIVHQLQRFPKDSIIFDTIYEYVTVYDTVKIYDTITVKYSKFNKKRNKKQ